MKTEINNTNKETARDRFFIQEIINDLKKNGYSKGGKAEALLNDWSRELKINSGLRGRTKRTFYKKIGKSNW